MDYSFDENSVGSRMPDELTNQYYNLTEARILVTFQSFPCKDKKSLWFDLTDYDDLEEFLKDCTDNLGCMQEAKLIFLEWENIPDTLITRDRLSANFFLLREALEKLDESEQDVFMEWCKYHGYNVEKDEDPELLVIQFKDTYGFVQNIEFENYPLSQEIFNDNYD